MDYNVALSQINKYFLPYAGGMNRPVFYDITVINPALDEITRAYPQIRHEFERALTHRAQWPRYHDIDPEEIDISDTVDTDKNWNVFMLYLLGLKPEANRALCPKTCQLLEGIPNLFQAFFSVLDPGKSVPKHTGPYLGYIRYHLGLQIPKHNPPTFIINSQEYVWKEGEAVMFDDTWPHEVINHSQELRAVLIIDVFRPMPFLPSSINKGITYGIARPAYGRSVLRRIKRFARGNKPSGSP